MKKLYLIFMILALTVCTAYAYDAGDNSDRLSNGSSSVFSPGYINAAKQKTESIMNQMYPQKSFMERLLDNIKSGVEDNVDKASNNKATPEIKKKTSVKIAASQAAVTVSDSQVDQTEISAYIRDKIQVYIDDSGIGERTDYELKRSNGKYYVFWKSSYSAIKTQIFDSNGDAMKGAPITLTTADLVYANMDNVSASANGNVSVIWSEQDASNRYSIKMQMFNSSGNSIYATSICITGDRILYQASTGGVSLSSNGNVSVFWREYGTDYNPSLKTQTFDSSGNALSESPITLTGGQILNDANILNVVTASNGNLIVFWNEQKVIGSYYCYLLKTRTFDSSGSALNEAPFTLTDDRSLNSAYIQNYTTLSNGNIVVSWRELNLSGKFSLRTRTFDKNGNALNAESTVLTDYRVLNMASISKVYNLSNGNVVISWRENDSGNKYSLRVETFDSMGNVLSFVPTVLTGDRLLDSADVINISVLANGNVSLVWYETDYSSACAHSFRFQVFDSSGNVSYSPSVLTDDRSLSRIYFNNVYLLANGNVAVFWEECDLSGRSSLKAKIFDSYGNATSQTITLTDDRILSDASINNVVLLSNGNLAVFWMESDLSSKHSLKVRTFDSYGNALSVAPTTIADGGYSSLVSINTSNVTVLANGNLAVFWVETSPYYSSIRARIFDPYGNPISSQIDLSGYRCLYSGFGGYISKVSLLSNGNMTVFWVECRQYYSSPSGYATTMYAQTFNPGGIAIASQVNLTENRVLGSISVSSVSVQDDGNVAIFWGEGNMDSSVSVKSQVLGTNGSIVSKDVLMPRVTPTSTNNLTQDLLPDTFLNSLKSNILKNSSYGWELRSAFNNSSNNAVPEIFKSLLSSKGALATNMGRPTNEAELGRLITKALSSAIGVPSLTETQANTPEMQVAMALANILKNPTEDQKIIIDAVAKLLEDVSKIEGEAGKSEELTKAENDLLKMAAAVLFAQGVPDLLKEGDVENMKGMFKDLGASKDKALMDYKDSVKPYYNNIAKEIAANIAVLETKGMVKKNLTEEQLKKLEPREIDRILENIRKNNDKSFELEYILQQDSKYRKEYLDPSKKLMEDNMKLILGSFAKKLSDALEDKK